MSKWEMVRLGDVFFQIKNGASIKQGLIDGGIPITRIETISDGIVDREKFGYAGISDEKYSAFYLEDGDILMSHINSVKHLGKVALYKKDGEEKIIHGMNLLCLRSNVAHSEYVFYFFKSNLFKNQIPPITKKSVNQASFTVTALKELAIPLPPLDEQKRIAKTLDLASEIVKGYKQQLAELDKLVQSVFYEMFGESKTNPMQWKMKKLGEISRIGSSKRVFRDELVESGIPFYRGTEIGALATKSDINIEYFITEEHYNELCKASGMPIAGDLLMPSICNDGRIWRVDNDKPFYFKDGRVLWVHFDKQDNDNIYVQLALREKLINDYNNIASGTTFAELKIFALKNVDIMLPPLPLQTRFAEIVTAIEAQKSQVQTALTEAETLFNSLMQKYFE